MSATKNWLITTEEKCWDDVAEAIDECENISEAMDRAGAIFSQARLIGYLSVEEIDEAVSEMWNEKWSTYV